MTVYVVVANNEYESSEYVLGVAFTLEKAIELENENKNRDYTEIYECEIDTILSKKVKAS